MKISFISKLSDPSLPKPVPAIKSIPEWYKLTPRYVDGEKTAPTNNSQTSGTIKACMPVLDAMTAGYLLLSSSDLFISKKDNATFYNWASYDLISFHSQRQNPHYPKIKEKIRDENIPKFENYWIVKTPKNYSCLFIPPMHQDLPFAILPGIVDTDRYTESVNFPFIPDPNFEGLIPRGTPIAQVIPFCRESWSMSVDYVENSEKIKKDFFYTRGTLNSLFFDRYKKTWWQKKEYK